MRNHPGIIRSIGNIMNDGDDDIGSVKGFDLSVLERLASTISNLQVSGGSRVMRSCDDDGAD